ncbi:phage tail tube protein [Clostridium sp. Mt-5]|uniref:Phage tail tube protein n=1 Tax=Clostridium moutaii TaxID=3240932 RepID=A0ABV4BS49_9CLOT
MDISNKVLSGTEADLWINGDEIEERNKVEIKVEGVYDAIELAGDYATHNRYMGWKGTGTLTLFKMHSRALNLIGGAFKTGVFPDIDIIGSMTNKQTGETERLAIHGVQITEFDFQYETKKSTQEAIPFTFTDYDVLEAIS